MTTVTANRPPIKPEDAAKQNRVIRADVPGVTSISMLRRLHDSRFAGRYFRGDGIDVGGGQDSLALCQEFFPLARHIFVYDMEHGDAQLMENVDDETFDFLYSSHCLEHMRDAEIALRNWIRVIRPGGHLVVQAPDEDLYEQGRWPSPFNGDHKLSFTIHKDKSWSPVSINVMELLIRVSSLAETISLARMDHGFRFGVSGKGFDQTRTPMAECGIEFVLRKR